MSIVPKPDPDISNEEELFNPGRLAGDNVWEPDPKTILELYEKLDKDGVIELSWKSPGRMPKQELTTPQKPTDIVMETPEEESKLRDKKDMLSMFDADDLSNQFPTPSSLTKAPSRTPKNTPKAKASFDKIFNKVSLQSTGEDKSDSNT